LVWYSISWSKFLYHIPKRGSIFLKLILDKSENNYLLFIGIAFLFIGAIDLLHTLAYRGMGVFPGYDANRATQFWIAFRYIQSLSFLMAPLFLGRKLKPNFMVAAYTAVTILVLGSIFYWDIFPDCFIEGKGLTPFKKISEYIIALLFLGSLGALIKKRKEFDTAVLGYLFSAILLSITAEMAFTFYISVYGLSNLIGHFFEIFSYYLIYKAIIETGFKRPYDLLFRNLKLSEEALKKAKEELENKVVERTREWQKANEQLRFELSERRRAEEALRKSADEIHDLYNKAPCGYHSLDEEGFFIRINDTELQWLGYSREDVIGRKKLADLLTTKSLKIFEQSFPRLKERGWVRDLEFEMIRKDGTILPVLLSATSIKDGQGNYVMSRATIYDMTEHKAAEKALEESEKQLRHLSSQLLMAQELERKGIARELHDGLGQTLTLIKYRVEKFLDDWSKKEGREDAETLQGLIPIIQGSIGEVRRIQMDLRPPILDDLGILATLSWFCREFEKTYSDIRIRKEIAIEEEEIPVPLRTVIYRISQEALNNIAKYSRAGQVRISLRKKEGGINLVIQDNGQGFELEKVLSQGGAERGLGLTSMRERAELSGGSFRIESSPGKGTAIQAFWAVEQLSS